MTLTQSVQVFGALLIIGAVAATSCNKSDDLDASCEDFCVSLDQCKFTYYKPFGEEYDRTRCLNTCKTESLDQDLKKACVDKLTAFKDQAVNINCNDFVSRVPDFMDCVVDSEGDASQCNGCIVQLGVDSLLGGQTEFPPTTCEAFCPAYGQCNFSFPPAGTDFTVDSCTAACGANNDSQALSAAMFDQCQNFPSDQTEYINIDCHKYAAEVTGFEECVVAANGLPATAVTSACNGCMFQMFANSLKGDTAAPGADGQKLMSHEPRP